MWKPTHVQLTVHKARNLKLKGKSGTNDCYATIQLGKEKYHTSIKEKCADPEWNEECDFSLPEEKSMLKLCLYHRNFIGIDDFLGQTEICLEQFNAYERPRKRWFPLFCKASSKKHDRSRGEVELSAIFMVQNASSSVCTLDRQKKKSAKPLSFKNLSGSISSKLLHKWPSKTSLSGRSDLSSGNFSAQSTSQRSLEALKQDDMPAGAESAVVSSSLASLAEEDSAVDSKQASSEFGTSSIPADQTNSSSEKLPLVSEERSKGDIPLCQSLVPFRRSCAIPENANEEKMKMSREVLSIKSSTMNQSHQMALYELHEIEEYRKNIQRSMQLQERSAAARDLHKIFEMFTNEDLMHLVVEQKQQLTQKDDYIRDLEDYIDNLLVKVIESQPKLLQKPGKETKATKESTPLESIMHYSTMPRSYSQAVPSTKTLPASDRKRSTHSFWKRDSPGISPLKKLQSFMK